MALHVRLSRSASLFGAILGIVVTALGVYFLVVTEGASTYTRIFLVVFVVAGASVTAYHVYNAITGKGVALFTGTKSDATEHHDEAM